MAFGWHGGGGHHHHGGHRGGGYWGPYWGGGYPETSILYDIVQTTLPCYVKSSAGYNTFQTTTASECTAIGGSLTPPSALSGLGADATNTGMPNWLVFGLGIASGIAAMLLVKK